MKVLGIDPGTRLTGFGCVEQLRGPRSDAGSRPVTVARDASLLDAGVIRLDTEQKLPDRLIQLEREFQQLLDELKPDLVAVEMLYANYKHPTTAIIMGHARGVILLAIRRSSIPLLELRATEIKKSLTGYGHAGKGQMQSAIKHEFALAVEPKPADVADALAIALAGLRRHVQK